MPIGEARLRLDRQQDAPYLAGKHATRLWAVEVRSNLAPDFQNEIWGASPSPSSSVASSPIRSASAAAAFAATAVGLASASPAVETPGNAATGALLLVRRLAGLADRAPPLTRGPPPLTRGPGTVQTESTGAGLETNRTRSAACCCWCGAWRGSWIGGRRSRGGLQRIRTELGQIFNNASGGVLPSDGALLSEAGRWGSTAHPGFRKGRRGLSVQHTFGRVKSSGTPSSCCGVPQDLGCSVPHWRRLRAPFTLASSRRLCGFESAMKVFSTATHS